MKRTMTMKTTPSHSPQENVKRTTLKPLMNEKIQRWLRVIKKKRLDDPHKKKKRNHTKNAHNTTTTEDHKKVDMVYCKKLCKLCTHTHRSWNKFTAVKTD